ncbi:type III pantothenate kinase [Microbulbifer litoralis]|uniref:type III pantothenate kinase n=1 Tax=Microbulbifer litoralis TaxID=2933965 RepID=UPI002029625E|nr:type III pantothenate kinase [Microbulbifer sp. GX H0434]
MSTLELDIGNTRTKWRLRESSGAVLRGVASTAELKSGGLPSGLLQLCPQRVRAANVAGPAAAAALAGWVQSQLGLVLELARVDSPCAGVTCAYRDPRRLGVDRWLALLAAHRRDPGPALVVDCGSAVTIDLLGAGGRHLGGYILPGLAAMRGALYRDTDAVKVAERLEPGMSLAPGRDTDSAVNRGLPMMVLGAIDRALRELVASGGPEPGLWLTGGDGRFFSSLCDRPHQLVPELVLDGLVLSNP